MHIGARCTLEVLSRAKAKLAGVLHSSKDGGEGLEPWQTLGSAQVSPFEEVAFPSTKQYLKASVPIRSEMVTLNHVLVANLSQSPLHLPSVGASLLEVSSSHLQGCHCVIQRTVISPCLRRPRSPALNKRRGVSLGAVQLEIAETAWAQRTQCPAEVLAWPSMVGHINTVVTRAN